MPGTIGCLRAIAASLLALTLWYTYSCGWLHVVDGMQWDWDLGIEGSICFGFAIALAIVGNIMAWRYRPRVPEASKCRRCGYDLRGNVSGVCPECGTRIKSLQSDERE
jgi:hypothetical protein